jgi:hypothetical protein
MNQDPLFKSGNEMHNAEARIPSGWLSLKDEKTKRKYYHNTVTGETTWTAPTKPALGFMVGGGELPEGWIQVDDSKTGNMFYHNLVNNAVTWTRPMDAATAAMEDEVVPSKGGWMSVFTYSKAKAELKHYWLGVKLLVVEIKIATGVISRILQGHALTRREHKQLVRTVADIFRLVPFAIFVVIPFMEFLLPFAIKLFPNMLPSTFQDQLKEEEKMKQSLKLRMNMAEFLQDTLTQMAKDLKKNGERSEGGEDLPSDTTAVTATSLIEFLEDVRSGETVSTEMILRYAPLFRDDITLDNMPRPQLVSMCTIMGLRPYGTDAFLRFQLRNKLRVLQSDDKDILWEGIEALNKRELQLACQERGMPAVGLSTEEYRLQMSQWLDLSANKQIPPALLIMSRAFINKSPKKQPGSRNKIPGPKEAEIKKKEMEAQAAAVIAETLSALDHETVTEVVVEEAKVTSKDEAIMLLEHKLESIETQAEMIEEVQYHTHYTPYTIHCTHYTLLHSLHTVLTTHCTHYTLYSLHRSAMT